MKLFLITILLIITGFVTSVCFNEYIPEDEQAVNKLISQIEKTLSTKYHMRAVATTISMPRGSVKKLGLDFHINGPLSKEELRKILVHAAQDFVFAVNADEAVKPYLVKVPFEINNIQINLFVEDSTRREIEHPEIGVAGIIRGELDYCTLTIINNIPKYITEKRETYEEALSLLNESSENQKKQD